MKNNEVRIGRETIESNAELRDICQRGHYADPAYDPDHDWRELGDDQDGHTYYRCRKCGKERQ